MILNENYIDSSRVSHRKRYSSKNDDRWISYRKKKRLLISSGQSRNYISMWGMSPPYSPPLYHSRHRRSSSSSSSPKSISSPTLNHSKTPSTQSSPPMTLEISPKLLSIDQNNLICQNDRPIGPSLPNSLSSSLTKNKPHQYGFDLLPGEGESMANYVRQGQRIPRRGEVGLTNDEIENFEKSGYVMSGNRHKAMNAVRLRKENQVYSVEEKKALHALHNENRVMKEHKIINQFRQWLNQKPS